MKTLIFLLAFMAGMLVTYAQAPTVKIVNVVTGTQNGIKGDFVTVTVTSPYASGFNLLFDIKFDNGQTGGAGGYGYPESEMFSHTTTTITRFCGLQNSYANKGRTWTVTYNFVPDDPSDPSIPASWNVSDSFYVPK